MKKLNFRDRFNNKDNKDWPKFKKLKVRLRGSRLNCKRKWHKCNKKVK